MGLLEAVEKNFMKFLEIITDYLNWHFEKMREPASSDPEVVTPEFPATNYKRRKKFTELFIRVRTLFGAKENKEPDIESNSIEEDNKKEAKAAETIDNAGNNERNITEAYSIDVDIDQLSATIQYHDEESEDDDTNYDETEEYTSASQLNDEGNSETIIESGPDENIEGNKEKVPDDTIEVPEDESEIEKFAPDDEEDPDIAPIDGTDIFDESGSESDNEYLEEKFIELGVVPMEKSRYQKECFLKFGFEDIDQRLRLDDVQKYLTVRGFSDNSYRRARKRDAIEDTMIDLKSVNHCDFCGMPISGVSYEKLNDGRIRCNDCSTSAIKSVEIFRELFRQHLALMENFFGINYKGQIEIKMSDANKIAHGYGSVFKPSAEVASRVLGYAQKHGKGRYRIFLENGSPRLATIDTMIHELTHIWQFENWKTSEITRLYPESDHRDIVYEGMAVWTSIQYMYMIGENSYAQKQEILMDNRKDLYGDGFRMYSEKYPINRDSSINEFTPFAQFPPL